MFARIPIIHTMTVAIPTLKVKKKHIYRNLTIFIAEIVRTN